MRGREPFVPLRYVTGPNGNVLTIADLPPATTIRWVKRRKAEVVLAVEAGLLSLEDACRRYDLTVEEFSYWEVAVRKEAASKARRTIATRAAETRSGFGGRALQA